MCFEYGAVTLYGSTFQSDFSTQTIFDFFDICRRFVQNPQFLFLKLQAFKLAQLALFRLSLSILKMAPCGPFLKSESLNILKIVLGLGFFPFARRY